MVNMAALRIENSRFQVRPKASNLVCSCCFSARSM